MASPDFLNTLGDAMGNVYAATHDRLLVNLARHFKYVASGRYEDVGASFRYQARMLAAIGQVTSESLDIIMDMYGGAGQAQRDMLAAAILDSVAEAGEEYRRAVALGLMGEPPPPVAPHQMQTFQLYYRQSMDRLNLVNTAMLESTQAAYRRTVADVVNRLNRVQGILNESTGEMIAGAEDFNKALRLATDALVKNGIAGFVDHAGRRWRPETYVSMDMRSTYHNASRAAFWEEQERWGVDLYLVSQHPGARPLCYPWQCKVISRTGAARDVTDADGNPVHVYAQGETSYGEPAGLFGINCGHQPLGFVPGVSRVPALIQDEAANAQTYALSQQHRALEREVRMARLRLAVEKARGGDREAVKARQNELRAAADRLQSFCDETGRKRRREREYMPVNADWPDPRTFDPADFPTATRDALTAYFKGGGAQNGGLTGGKKDGIIDVEVDEMTPCLRKVSTGELVETTIRRISPTRAMCKNWEFDWTRPERSGFEVYALRVKGDRAIQGMIAMKNDPTNLAVNVDIVESAPQNSPHNRLNTTGEKEYTGVGGHLFAEACRRSFEQGYDGFVYFKAKSRLVEYYERLLGAKLINAREHLMLIETKEALRLVERYYGGV